MDDTSNRQAGIATGDGIKDSDRRIATGRRQDVRMEPDPDHIATAVHLRPAEGPLPPQQASASVEAGAQDGGAPVEDVAVAPDGPSVWDARPVRDDTAKDGAG
jgi:hypothetical protein